MPQQRTRHYAIPTLELAADFRQAILGEKRKISPAPIEVSNPYKGLRAFQEYETGDFSAARH